MIKNVKLVESNISIAIVFLNMQTLKVINVCVVTKIINTSLTKMLKERFFNTYKFSDHDNNKFILLL